MAVCADILPTAVDDEEPLWKGFTFHHFGLFLAAVFGLVSVVLSLFLIMQHATHYIKPSEQKHIIRIVFMVPVYSVVSFLSYLYWRQSVYFEVLRDCYEAFAISSFFALMCSYVAPSLHDQKEYFRTIQPKNWFLSFFGLQKCTGGQNKGPLRKPRSGLTWFNIIWVGIFQYCFIRVFFTIVSVVTQAFDVYCESSLSPAFAHVWTVVFECLSVTIAMTMVVQFYIQLKDDLAEHKPGLKVLSIKLVIFFCFWQTIIISLLSSSRGPLKQSARLSYPDIKVGIPSVMLCIEMAGFSIMHLFAYPWKPYSLRHSYKDPLGAPGTGYSGDAPPKYQGGPLGIRALLDAFNPWDIIKASARGFRWLFVGYRHRLDDASYEPSKLSDNTGYMGPSFSGNGEPATELGYNPRPAGRGRTDFGGGYHGEDDRAGLLHDTQRPGATGPYQPYELNDYRNHDEDADLSLRTPSYPQRAASPGIGIAVTGDMKPSEMSDWDDDTGYHPGMGPSPGSGIATGSSGSVHPAFRPNNNNASQTQSSRFNSSSPWAAPYPPSSNEPYYSSSLHEPSIAPSYRTEDPHAR